MNVILAYPFYISAIIFPTAIWLGLGQVLFGMTQIFMHGLLINKKMKRWYNPGLASVVFLHFPIGIYYIWYVATNGLAHGWDYIFGLVVVAVGAVLMVALPVRGLANRNTKYPFFNKEMEKFHVKEKMQSLTRK